MSDVDIAQKIRKLRKDNNMTLEDVAKIVGVGKSTVRKWETGMIKNMGRDKIDKLAAALHTTPIELMGWQTPDADVISALGTIHNKQNLPPEIEAVNTLLYSYGQQIIKVKDEYFFDEAGKLTEDELNEFLNTVTSMVHSIADTLIKKKTRHNLKNFFNNTNE